MPFATHQSDPDLSVRVGRPVHVLRSEETESSGGDDLLEKVEVVVSKLGVRELCDAGGTRPRDDRDEDDTVEKSASDLVLHENRSDETSEQGTEPDGRVLQDVRVASARANVRLVLRRATGELEGSGRRSRNDTQTRTAETDDGEEQTDTGGNGENNRSRQEPNHPLAETKDGEDEEENTLEEDGGEGFTISDDTGTVESDLGVGEESVDTETWGETEGEVGERAHEESRDKSDRRGAGE